MKKFLIVVVIVAVLGYVFGPGLFVSFTSNAFVSYIEEFDNAPEVKNELTNVVLVVTERVQEQGFETFLESLNEPDRKFLARSMDKIKDNGQGLLEKPLTDAELREMITRANKILGIESGVNDFADVS